MSSAAACGCLAFSSLVAATPAGGTKAARIDPEAHKLIQSDRADGRFVSTRGFVHALIRDVRPRLAFRADFSAEELLNWQEGVRAKLRELMRFPEVAAAPPARRVGVRVREGYTVERWEAYPQPGSVVPFLVLIPANASANAPAPGVLCFPGSDRTKESLAGEPEPGAAVKRTHVEHNRMALHYVRRGFVAVALDNPGIGEAADPYDDRSSLSRYLLDLGWHYLGLSAFQGAHVLEWMKTSLEIDRSRIAVSGHSLGTEPALVLAVLDPEVLAVVFNDYLCRLLVRARSVTKPSPDGRRPAPNWLGHCVPDLWTWFDYPDLAASLAPRDLLITEGGAAADLNSVRAAYEILGRTDHFSARFYPKYADASTRRDGLPIPEGLSPQEWFEYVNVDAPNHYFKADIAVPWLEQRLNAAVAARVEPPR